MTYDKNDDARTGRTRTLFAILLCVCGMISVAGCLSPAEKAFESARIGDSWKDVPNAYLYWEARSMAWRDKPSVELYWAPSPHWYYQQGSTDGQGTHYYVVTSEDGKIVAKAKERIKETSCRFLTTSMNNLSEFMEVEKHYPFFNRAVPIARANLKVLVSDYPPLAKPESDEDKILPSGTRQSTWAGLASSLQGWPFAERDRPVQAWLDGRVISWEVLVTKLEQGQLHGIVRLAESSSHD